jgi:hypothetical protein
MLARSATGHMDSRTFCDRRAVDGSNNRTPQRRLQLLSSSLRLSGVGSGGPLGLLRSNPLTLYLVVLARHSKRCGQPGFAEVS